MSCIYQVAKEPHGELLRGVQANLGQAELPVLGLVEDVGPQHRGRLPHILRRVLRHLHQVVQQLLKMGKIVICDL